MSYDSVVLATNGGPDYRWKLNDNVTEAIGGHSTSGSPDAYTATIIPQDSGNCGDFQTTTMVTPANAADVNSDITTRKIISMWLVIDTFGSGTGTNATFIWEEGGATNWLSCYTANSNELYFCMGESSAETGNVHATSLSTGTLYHVVFQWQSSDGAMELWVNGSKVSTDTSTGGDMAAHTGAWNFGGGDGSKDHTATAIGGTRFDGRIADYAYWAEPSRFLTTNEIIDIYNAGTGSTTSTSTTTTSTTTTSTTTTSTSTTTTSTSTTSTSTTSTSTTSTSTSTTSTSTTSTSSSTSTTTLDPACVVDQYQNVFDYLISVGNLTYEKVSQSFIPDYIADICNVKVGLSKWGNPTDELQLSIYDDSGGEPNALIASATNTASGASVPTILYTTDFNFNFSSEIQLQAGTTYWIVLERTGALDSGDYYFTKRSDVSEYADGVFKYYDDGSWIGMSYDIYFYEYYDNTTIVTTTSTTTTTSTSTTSTSSSTSSSTTSTSSSTTSTSTTSTSSSTSTTSTSSSTTSTSSSTSTTSTSSSTTSTSSSTSTTSSSTSSSTTSTSTSTTSTSTSTSSSTSTTSTSSSTSSSTSTTSTSTSTTTSSSTSSSTSTSTTTTSTSTSTTTTPEPSARPRMSADVIKGNLKTQTDQRPMFVDTISMRMKTENPLKMFTVDER